MNTYEDVVKSLLESLAKEKHKVFISYYHYDDEFYRGLFELYFREVFINKSVQPNEIDSDNSDEYIKKLIQKEYITDASVLVVLAGAKTYCRKHVDWEISAALNKKVGGYSGLVGLLLPTHPDSGKQSGLISQLPDRLADNLNSGYARLYHWTENAEVMKGYIQEAFDSRLSKKSLIDNSSPQFQRNRCE